VTSLGRLWGRKIGSLATGHLMVTSIIGLVAAAIGLFGELTCAQERTCDKPPLRIGLTPTQAATIQTIREHTDKTARIWWETLCEQQRGESLTPLLPILTDRYYLGGLEARACMEHTQIGLDTLKIGKCPLSEDDPDFPERFFTRYNVGWVVAWSPELIAKLRETPGVRPIAEVRDNDVGQLFRIDREHTYFLRGQGTVIEASTTRIALGNLVPHDGAVVLSFHFQPGWRVLPSTVKVDRDLDPFEAVPLTRLRMNGPVARVTLVWDNP
jgi:hypothetical protein